LLLQSGDPYLEELVQVLRQNGEETNALEQGEAPVSSPGQDTLVEIELGKLAIEVAALDRRGGREGRFYLELDFPHRYQYMGS